MVSTPLNVTSLDRGCREVEKQQKSVAAIPLPSKHKKHLFYTVSNKEMYSSQKILLSYHSSPH